MTGSKFRNLEPCSLENIGEPLYNKYDLECKHFSTVKGLDTFGLRFDELNVTSLLNEKLTKDFKLKYPKTIEYKSDYLELIRFLKKDIVQSNFEFTKELGKLLGICAKYYCKLVFSPEIMREENNCSGLFSPNQGDGFKYIFIKILEENPPFFGDFTSSKDFMQTLRHEVFHLIQYQFGFGILGIDIFDKSAKEVLGSNLYDNCSINELICEFEAFSADKVPFMACEIESHLSQFSSIEDNKYAASSKRIKTIELIARERRIPIYSKKDKSIFLEDKEIEKIFNEEL